MPSPLFTPFQFRNLTLRNRFVMAPMTINQSPGNILNEANIDRYEQRAKGGVGLIITEGVLIDHPFAAGLGNSIPALIPSGIPQWRRLADRLHQHGTKLFIQVWHQGPQARPGIGAEEFRERGEVVVRAIGPGDLEDLLDCYERAAHVILETGADGFELHAAHGYLLWDIFRKGHKQLVKGHHWTGVGFIAEIIRRMRKIVGPDMPIQLRFSQWSVTDYSYRYIDSPDMLKSLLHTLMDAGVDLFHASAVNRCFYLPAFEGSPLNIAQWTRQVTGVPVTLVGNVGLKTAELTGNGPQSLSTVEALVETGQVDLVAVGRPLLADPEWVNKVRDQRFAEIMEFKG